MARKDKKPWSNPMARLTASSRIEPNRPSRYQEIKKTS